MNPSMRLMVLIFQLAVATAWLSTSPRADADLHDEMDGRWFVTEIIVFERERVGLVHGGEPLLTDTDWQWPANMHLIRRASTDGAALDPDGYRERDTLKLRASDRVPSESAAATQAVNANRDWRSQLAEFEAELSKQGPVWLDASALTMTSHRRDIERRLGASILFHGAWRQDVPGRESPYPIMLKEPDASLFGVLSVTVNRFLHVSASLNFPVTGSAVIVDNARPQASPPSDSIDAGQPNLQLVSGVMRLRESRRVRSEELHYLDHPRFGVLLRIQEIGFPEALETAWRERTR